MYVSGVCSTCVRRSRDDTTCRHEAYVAKLMSHLQPHGLLCQPPLAVRIVRIIANIRRWVDKGWAMKSVPHVVERTGKGSCCEETKYQRLMDRQDSTIMDNKRTFSGTTTLTWTWFSRCGYRAWLPMLGRACSSRVQLFLWSNGMMMMRIFDGVTAFITRGA